MRKFKRLRHGFLASAVLLGAVSVALGVHVQSWTHQKQTDFVEGQFDNVVIDNFGELTLGRTVTPVELAGKADFVNCFAQAADGAVYAGTSGHGAVYKIQGDKAEFYYSAPGTQDQILSLAKDGKGGVLAALCGDGAKVVRLTAGADGKVTAAAVFENSDVDYIWAMRGGADGSLYLATGPRGQVWKVPADGSKAAVLFETGAKNVYSLAVDGKGNLIAGTDSRGLVMRWDAASQKAFVLLDAGDVDVTALALDEAGNIYAATATADEGGRGPKAPPEPSAPKPAKPGKVEPDVVPPDDTPDAAGAAKVHGVLPPPVPMAKGKPPPHKGPGAPPDEPLTTRGKPGRGGAGGMPGMHPPEEDENPEGNAIYKIGPDGAVSTLVSKPEMMLALLFRDGELLIGTGTQGKVYSYRPATEAEALVARVGQDNVTSLFAAADGTIYFGTANTGQIYRMGARTAGTGTYTSPVLDAKNTAVWGSASVMATVPPGARATIAVRTGNVEDVKQQEKFWSAWSAEIPAGEGKKMEAPSARYLQYRVTLTGIEEGGQTRAPTVEQIRVAYQVENLPPKIKELTVDSGAEPTSDEMGGPAKPPGEHADSDKTTRISWDASDPNHDEMTYRIYYREVGTEEWIPLARDLKEMEYAWNTQAVSDGKYQVKVIATDAPDNTAETAKSTAQVTSPFLVVNAAPVISDLQATMDGNKAHVTGTAKAKLCAITEVRFQVDGQADWQAAGALDKMFDSPSEGFTLSTRALAVGSHKITVRATDTQGNSGYQALTVNVK